MKKSIFPFLLGGMTVFGVWMAYNNRKALDKLVTTVNDSTEQAIQKFKDKMDSTTCNCNNDECACGN